MTCIATDSTDDVGCEIACLRTVVLAVPDLTAILAGLILVIAKCAVESSELTKLVALELVLAFGNGGSL